MSKRQRWTPVRGTGSRVYDAQERLLLGLLDAPGRIVAAFGGGLGLRHPAPEIEAAALKDVLVLRLDRLGDVLMSLPALVDLRRALPASRIRLAVGAWSQEVARNAPVDELLVWSAPWAGRPAEGADTARALWRKARALSGLDLALDLQGDVRASALLWGTRARVRAGYANTGGAYLLTHVLPLDETLSWIEQNRRAVASVVGSASGPPVAPGLTASERASAAHLLDRLGLAAKRPLVGIHPSGGRRIKQWDPGRWAAVGARLQRERGATLVLTGSEADRQLAATVSVLLPEPAMDLTGRLSVGEMLALVASLDLFLSADTGPMHIACASGTPSVSVFGPSDPVRYFSGADYDPAGRRHRAIRAELWCSPCNLIRKPPAECRGLEGPECLRLVGVEEVWRAAAAMLPAHPSDRPENPGNKP